MRGEAGPQISTRGLQGGGVGDFRHGRDPSERGLCEEEEARGRVGRELGNVGRETGKGGGTWASGPGTDLG